MKYTRVLATLPILFSLSGCATTSDWWNTAKQTITGSQATAEEAQNRDSMPQPSASAMENGYLFQGNRDDIFRTAVRTARELSWKIENARMEDRFIEAWPKATIFAKQQVIIIHVLQKSDGVLVKLVTETGEMRSDFESFYARMNELMASQ